MVHQVFLQYNTVRACCLLSRNWLTLSQLCGVDKKQFCSNTSDSHSGQNNENLLSFKEKMIRKHHYPQEEHARLLQQKFPEPKKVVDDLFAPFENVEESLIPNIEKTHKLGNQICVTKLNLKWPKSVNIVGKHENENTSTEYAYLNTCDFLTKIGLVKIPLANEELTTKPYDADNVIKVLEELASMQTAIAGFETSNFRVLNLLQNDKEDDDIFWSSSIRVAWPVSFTVNSRSACLSLAYYQSCLKAIMKLKGLGYLDQKNHLKRGILLSLERYGTYPWSSSQNRDLTNPDFELFVDASKHGIGAYLISKDDDRIRWMADRWVENKIKFDPLICSTMSEFYAFLTAFYTWKHKFVNKKIIVYGDNELVINIINQGLFMLQRPKLKHSLYKLYLLLIKICHENNITVVGMHVPRFKNVAADQLSRIHVNTFKQMVPAAYENPKKSKKLWFYDFTSTKNFEKLKKDGENLEEKGENLEEKCENLDEKCENLEGKCENLDEKCEYLDEKGENLDEKDPEPSR